MLTLAAGHGLHRLYSFTATTNIPSERVMQKIGMTKIGDSIIHASRGSAIEPSRTVRHRLMNIKKRTNIESGSRAGLYVVLLRINSSGVLFGHHFPDEVTLSFKLLIDITVGKLVQSRGRVKHIGFAREASTLYLKFADRIARYIIVAGHDAACALGE